MKINQRCLNRMIEGEDAINQLLMGAMSATVHTLGHRGLISKEDAEQFLNENICMAVAKDGPFTSWLKRKFGNELDSDKIVIAKIG